MGMPADTTWVLTVPCAECRADVEVIRCADTIEEVRAARVLCAACGNAELERKTTNEESDMPRKKTETKPKATRKPRTKKETPPAPAPVHAGANDAQQDQATDEKAAYMAPEQEVIASVLQVLNDSSEALTSIEIEEAMNEGVAESGHVADVAVESALKTLVADGRATATAGYPPLYAIADAVASKAVPSAACPCPACVECPCAADPTVDEDGCCVGCGGPPLAVAKKHGTPHVGIALSHEDQQKIAALIAADAVSVGIGSTVDVEEYIASAPRVWNVDRARAMVERIVVRLDERDFHVLAADLNEALRRGEHTTPEQLQPLVAELKKWDATVEDDLAKWDELFDSHPAVDEQSSASAEPSDQPAAPPGPVWDIGRAQAYVHDQIAILAKEGDSRAEALREGLERGDHYKPELLRALFVTVLEWDPVEAEKPETWAGLFVAPEPTPSAPVDEELFDVVLLAAGDNKSALIKVLRGITGLGLAEGRDLAMATLPKTLKTRVPRSTGEMMAKWIVDAGGAADLQPSKPVTWNDVAKASADAQNGVANGVHVNGVNGAAVDPPRRFMREVECPLAANELVELLDVFLKVGDRIAALEREKKAANEAFKDRLELLEAEENEIRGQLRGAKVKRKVPCELIINGQTARIVRTDTAEVLEERLATPEELQVGHPGLGAEPAPVAPAKKKPGRPKGSKNKPKASAPAPAAQPEA